MIKNSLIVALALLSLNFSQAQIKPAKPAVKKTVASNSKKMLVTPKDKLGYAIGLNIANSIKQQGIANELNINTLAKAIQDAFAGGTLALSEDEAQNVLRVFSEKMQSKAAEEQAKASSVNEAEGKKFLDENKSKPGVKTTSSGLQYLVLTEGTGEIPKETDVVKTHYHGTLINGEVFDSSVQRGQPATFPVNGVIKGWIEALQLMKVGSKWKLFVPADLAYGDRGAGGKIGPGSTLIFEVELLSIEPKQ
jgi:FKBP-type peptidyl-prolyl cis-trans isomerase FklB